MRSCICVSGWYHPEPVFSNLVDTKVDIFVISHNQLGEASKWFFDLVPESNWFLEPNLGYDWGCYQQFIAKTIWSSYDVVFFMHDDLNIVDVDFVAEVNELINCGAQIVGNGPNSHHKSWPETHLQCYAHSHWIPPSFDFKHDTVRGSFFAITTEAIQRIQNFEVFWDPMHLNLRFGNHSLIATCGKLQAHLGENCFAFLGDDYRTSNYIIEKERGSIGNKAQFSPMQRLVTGLYNRFGQSYVSYRMNSASVKSKAISIRVMRQLLHVINGARLVQL